MAKNDNLTDFLTGIADTIRTQKNTSGLINPQDFESEISGLTDVSDTTAIAGDVLSGKDFYLADGTKASGTIETYSGATTRTANGTFSTANKYLATNLTVNVNGASQIYRHLNPTIIRIDLRNVTMPYTMHIYIRQGGNGRAFTMNWGDGSSPETISTSTSTQNKTHQYTSQGIWTIVFSPTDQDKNRFLLTSSFEVQDMLTFDSYMFGQSSNSHFAIPISIYCGDCTQFRSNALSFCDNIEVLDFTNRNSLLEKSVATSAYYTQNTLATDLCRSSIIWTLIIGSGINEFKGNCFNGSQVWNMIIIDCRGAGISNTPITIPSSSTLPTINGKILINHLRLSRYKSASYWSEKSSYMFGY